MFHDLNYINYVHKKTEDWYKNSSKNSIYKKTINQVHRKMKISWDKKRHEEQWKIKHRTALFKAIM